MRQATLRPPQGRAPAAPEPVRARRGPGADDGQPYRRAPGSPRRRRALLLAAAALVVFGLFGAVAWYAYLEGVAGIGGEPPLIRADARPYKHVPDDRGGLAVANQSAAVIDVFRPAPEVPEPESLPPADPVPATDPTAAAARLESPPDAPDPASLPPIVQAPAAPLPPPAPLPAELPEAFGATEPPPSPPLDPADLPEEVPPDDVAAAAGVGVWIPVPKPAAPGAVAVAEPPPSPPPARAERQPAPPPRAAAAAAPSRPAPARAEPPPAPPRATTAALDPVLQPATPRPAGGNSYRLQLLALRSEGAMNQAWSQLRQRYPAVLEGLAPSVERIATVSGTMYRLQAGPFATRDAATDACAAIQAQGGQCFVVSLAQ